MDLTQLTPPAVTPISLTEAKAHLRVTHTDDDTAITALIDAATARLDARHGVLGRALITQSWRLRIDRFPVCWPYAIDLPFPPLQSVQALKYLDSDGAEQTLATSEYTVETSQFVGRVLLGYGKSWPSIRCTPGAVRLEFTAGFGAAGSNVPMPVRQAMLLLVGHLYATRDEDAPMPRAVEALLSSFRLLKL